MNFRKKLIRNLVYYFFIILYHIFKHLPPGWNLRAGAIIGRISFYIIRRERRRAIEHLTLVYGRLKNQKAIKSIARENFKRIGMNIMENISMDRIIQTAHELVIVEGLDIIYNALQQKRGLIWVTGHIGNWEIMPVYFSCVLKLPVSVIAAPLYDERLTEFIKTWREKFGVQTIYRGGIPAYREIRNCFIQNRMLGILIDQDTKVPGVFVNFFGMKAYTPRGAIDLALRFKAPVVLGFVERIHDNHHRISIQPFNVEEFADKEKSVIENTQRLTKIIEEEIDSRIPDWVWMHRRWKRKEEGAIPY